MQQLNLRAFTLVELIVVITIVGILSTVGFVSYSSYLTGARDSNRISQMVKLSDSLQVYSATRSLPLPDNHVEITASGELIAYQGEVGTDVLETIDYTNGGTDPKDDSFYTYYLTKDRGSLQLMALMEEQESIAFNNSNTSLNSLLTGEMKLHAQFEDRFPKVYGRKLGILTELDTNIPIQELSNFNSTPFDVLSEIGYVAHISDDEKIDGVVAGDLSATIANGSCSRIKQTGGSYGNGVYTINPAGEDFNVYCDMETDGGGWTLIAKVNTSAQDNVDEPANWFVEQNKVWDLINTNMSLNAGVSSLGSHTISSQFNRGGIARFEIIAQNNINQKGVWYKEIINSSNFESWFNGNTETTNVCSDYSMSKNCAFGAISETSGYTILQNMSLGHHGYTGGNIHMRLNGEVGNAFSSVCSLTSNNNNNAWDDSYAAHWGNGMLIFVK